MCVIGYITDTEHENVVATNNTNKMCLLEVRNGLLLANSELIKFFLVNCQSHM